MNYKTRAARIGAVGGLLAGLAGAWADELPAPGSVPAEAFFGVPQMYRPKISPRGSAAAVLMRGAANRRVLAVIDTKNLHDVKIVAGYDDADVVWAEWVDDKRLVYSVGDEGESLFEQRGSGLFAVDRDGTDPRVLVYRRGVQSETGTHIHAHTLAPRDYHFSQTLEDGSDDVIVEHYIHTNPTPGHFAEVTGTVPLRLNTRSGILRDALGGSVPDHVMDWTFDDRGVARMAVSVNEGVEAVLSPDKSGAWVERAHFPAFGHSPGTFSVGGVGADGVIYAMKPFADEFGSRSVYRLDAETGLPQQEPFVHMAGFDLTIGGTGSNVSLVGDHAHHRLLGLHYDADARGSVWFDPEMKALQAKIDGQLPGLVNRLDVAACGCARYILVTSSSDRQPAVYFLYDRDEGALIQLGRVRPLIDARQMAVTDFTRIKARDGSDLPVYVTKPRGKGPFPTVVLVHGGPFVRGEHWEWSAESQFLASRGYAVVRPEFRGSRGYGDKLFEAGFKQWGLKMQDDIADATLWAAKAGIADASRVCIAGASYGGYATLMGLVRYGDLYRCGVAWAAVTDINLMYDIGWSDASDEWKGYGMPAMIGDQAKDAEQLQATSPLAQSSRIKRPLLLAHGGIDRRVPIVHALKLRDALQAEKAPLTWIEYNDEGHGWMQTSTRVAFYERVEAFLAAQIGAGPASSAAPAPSAASGTH